MSPVNRVHEDRLRWNARIRTYRGAPFTGVGFRLHPNGVFMFEIPYIDGRADGLMQEWDEEGRITGLCDLGKSNSKKLEPGDPDYGWVMELAEQAVARLPPELLESIPTEAERAAIHQPLHCESDNDRGGNQIHVRYPGRPNPTNLHAVWDSAIIQDAMGDQSATGYAEALEGTITTDMETEWLNASQSSDWANEAHAA